MTDENIQLRHHPRRDIFSFRIIPKEKLEKFCNHCDFYNDDTGVCEVTDRMNATVQEGYIDDNYCDCSRIDGVHLDRVSSTHFTVNGKPISRHDKEAVKHAVNAERERQIAEYGRVT